MYAPYSRFAYHDPTDSPWGRVQDCDRLYPGIFKVSTAGHGGIMVNEAVAADILSPAALACESPDQGFLCFEEDCDAAIVIREMLDKGIYPFPEYVTNHAEFEEMINDTLHDWNPEYWQARENVITAAKGRETPAQNNVDERNNTMNTQENSTLDMRMDIRTFPVEARGNSNLLAFASVNFGGCYAAQGIEVRLGANGPFVKMPSSKRKAPDNRPLDVCYPTTADFRAKLYDAILDNYQQTKDGKILSAREQADTQPEAPQLPDDLKLDVRAYPIDAKGNSNLLAFANVTLNDCFATRDIAIKMSANGPFVDMPDRKGSDDKYHDVCFPTTKEFRAKLFDLVLDKYKEAVAEIESKGQKPSTRDQVKQNAKTVAEQPRSETPARTKVEERAS